jgi:hypothetical protein
MNIVVICLCLCRAPQPATHPPRSMRALSALSVRKTNAELRERERQILRVGR